MGYVPAELCNETVRGYLIRWPACRRLDQRADNCQTVGVASGRSEKMGILIQGQRPLCKEVTSEGVAEAARHRQLLPSFARPLPASPPSPRLRLRPQSAIPPHPFVYVFRHSLSLIFRSDLSSLLFASLERQVPTHYSKHRWHLCRHCLGQLTYVLYLRIFHCPRQVPC